MVGSVSQSQGTVVCGVASLIVVCPASPSVVRGHTYARYWRAASFFEMLVTVETPVLRYPMTEAN